MTGRDDEPRGSRWLGYALRGFSRRDLKAMESALPALVARLFDSDEVLLVAAPCLVQEHVRALCLVSDRRVAILEREVLSVVAEAPLGDIGLPTPAMPRSELRIQGERGATVAFESSGVAIDVIIAIRQTVEPEGSSVAAGDPDDRALYDLHVLGGYGLGLSFGDVVSIVTDAERIELGSDGRLVAALGYDEVTSLQIGGPGAVTRGGSFIGGGFGVVGAAEGMLAASVLNALTTRTTITTILYLQTRTAEVIMRYSRQTPEELRITLSPVLGRLRATVPMDRSSGADPVARIRELAALRDEGLLTDAEFEAAKARLLGTL